MQAQKGKYDGIILGGIEGCTLYSFMCSEEDYFVSVESGKNFFLYTIDKWYIKLYVVLNG